MSFWRENLTDYHDTKLLDLLDLENGFPIGIKFNTQMIVMGIYRRSCVKSKSSMGRMSY